MADSPKQVGVQNGGDESVLHARLNASSELLFVLLPFLVIAIVLSHKGSLATIFFLPEWSLVSAVILGQSLMRLVSAIVGRRAIEKEKVLLLLTAILVFGLIPVLIILAIVLTTDRVSPRLAYTQAVMFVLSTGLFWWCLCQESQIKSSKWLED